MSAQLSAVLAQIDADLDASLGRLFDFVRIPSISTDPKWKADCAKAADWLAADLASIGFEAAVRPTPGHPVVVGQAKGGAGKPHVLFYGHYDVQPVDPLNLWDKPPFEPQLVELSPGRKVIVAAAPATTRARS